MNSLKWTILASTLLTSGCAVREANLRMFNDQRPTTATERAAVITEAKSTFLDPYSVRDPQISYAAPSMTVTGEMTLNVCVSANAKNAFGAYTGKRTTLYYLSASGRVLGTNQDMFAQTLCTNPLLLYQPLDELMKG